MIKDNRYFKKLKKYDVFGFASSYDLEVQKDQMRDKFPFLKDPGLMGIVYKYENDCVYRNSYSVIRMREMILSTTVEICVFTVGTEKKEAYMLHEKITEKFDSKRSYPLTLDDLVQIDLILEMKRYSKSKELMPGTKCDGIFH